MQDYSTLCRGLPVWHGTHQEAIDLLNATLRYCSCILDDANLRVTTCPPHAMVFSDQRALNGLVFARRIYARLVAEEFAIASPSVLAWIGASSIQHCST